jgi:hypothetical protein
MSRSNEVIAFVVVSDLYDIRADGAVFTKIHPNGRIGKQWRQMDRLNNFSGRRVITAQRLQLEVSRVVYWKFKGPIPEGMTVDHINEDRTDNRLENLQLMTSVENVRKSLKENPRRKALTTADYVGNYRFSESDIREIRRKRSEGAKIADIAAAHCASKGQISEICNRKVWTHII